MKNTRERQRLKELFAGLETPTITPARKKPEIRAVPESPITELEVQPLEPEAGVAVLEPDPLVDILQVEEQPSDEPVLFEPVQEDTHRPAEVDILPEPTMSLQETSIVDSSPISASEQPGREIQVTPPPVRPLTHPELSLTNWQVAGIGTAGGMLVTVLLLGITYRMEAFDNIGRLVVAGIETLFGILGAFLSRPAKETRRAVWIESIKWALIPIVGALCLFLLFTIY